jgi:thiol-disulfide isomerase/thioredoxin
MNEDALNKFKGVLESIVFYATIARIKTNALERTFAQWCPKIRQIKDVTALNDFLKSDVIPAVNNWKKEYQPIFMVLGMDNIQQYRIRFILARISRFVDKKRQGAGDPTELTEDYIGKGVEIEHIMPKTISDADMIRYGITDRDDYDVIKSRLGNLTLLEKSLNASIHNDIYEDKAAAYRKSSFYLTSSLPELVNAGSDTAINRMNKKMKSWPTWQRKSIEERQAMLYDLAEEVWSLDNYVE